MSEGYAYLNIIFFHGLVPENADSPPMGKTTNETTEAVTRTTKLYDRTSDQITLDEIERIAI